MRVLLRVAIWGLWAAALLTGATVAAQPAGDGAARESHGWMGVESLDGGGGTLLHLPPRSVVSGPAAEAGTAQSVRVFESVPTAVAGWDRRAFLFFATETDRLDVFSLYVSPAGVSGAWLTEPATGASAEPSLDLDGAEFVSAAGCGDGLLVLGREGGADQTWRLWQLRGQGWEPVAFPDTIDESAVKIDLVGGSSAPTVMTRSASAVSRWSLVDGSSWEREELDLSLDLGKERVLSVFASGGDVVLAARVASGIEVWSLGPGLVGRIATMELDGRPVAAIPLDSGARLTVLSVVVDPASEDTEGSTDRWEVAELSVATGRELYRGPLRHPSLAIGNEVRWLSMVMMVMTVFVLFYLLRPAGEGPEPKLPEGFALAAPGRRLAGAVLDAALVGGVVSLALGVPVERFILVLPLFETAQGVMAFAVFIAAGAAYSTLAEWRFGRTIGKLMVGTRVVSIDPRRRRVGLMRSGARNAFRWGLTPWALVGLGSPDGRHRGDVIAGAAVVVAAEAEADDPEDADEPGDGDQA